MGWASLPRFDGSPMFALEFECTHRVLVARFSGVFSYDDIVEVDWAAIAFIAREGLVRSLFDFSAVEVVAVPPRLFVERGQLPQTTLGQERVIAAPRLELYALACAYASQQHTFGNIEPRVVLSLWDAYRLLGLGRPDFRAVPKAHLTSAPTSSLASLGRNFRLTGRCAPSER
jgi:hypothetical protein